MTLSQIIRNACRRNNETTRRCRSVEGAINSITITYFRKENYFCVNFLIHGFPGCYTTRKYEEVRAYVTGVSDCCAALDGFGVEIVELSKESNK